VKDYAMLTQELNRFLGHALLDTSLARQIFGGNRASAVSQYDLTPAECRLILSSTAQTLTELSRELCDTFVRADAADVDVCIGRMYQKLQVPEYPSTARIHASVQRAIGRLDDAQAQRQTAGYRIAS
jgi:hypothetical protein